MKNSLCILIRRAPYGQIHASEAIRHVGGALNEGIQTSVVLIDDGVFAARDGQDMGDTAWTPLAPALQKSMTKGARVFVHTPSAHKRGLFQDEHLVAGIEAVDDEGFARVLGGSDAVMVF